MRVPMADERQRAIELAKAGIPYKAVAAELERPYGTVARWMSDAILEGEIERRNKPKAPRTWWSYA